jgi:deazaflavin-dependent oxidoreductase (nitroreductase family)
LLGFPTTGGLVVIASNYGQATHPAWYYNLRAHPEGEVTVSGDTRPVRAAQVEGDQRQRIWREGLKIYPGWSAYERRAPNRQIAIFLLSPV